MRRHALHLYLDELEAMDSTFGGRRLPGGHHGRGSPFRVGIAESEGWNTYQGLVYCWNIFVVDYTYITMGDIATFSALYTT